tara:strand:- start:359 stop:478 length:120 start_codon:yes stop_codon:yes gene_type:complete
MYGFYQEIKMSRKAPMTKCRRPGKVGPKKRKTRRRLKKK